ncbi:MAG: SDR family oxidoreductase [Actinobacteria bacterium]|nr:MAG: SDR family oxidoreductase [Actinomycetota bacterium]
MEPKVALVTGASRGIGKATAVQLAAAGFDVAVAARTRREGDARDDEHGGRVIPGSLEATALLIEQSGRRALEVTMDLLDRPSLERGVARVLDEWGHIDVLVNNAVHTGAGSMDHFLDLSVALLETKLEANVVAQFVLAKLVVPPMLERGDGTIVNITSAVATADPPAPAGQGGWGMGYAMSKGAFHRMAGVLAVELGPRGIRAFNVEPGYVLTERMAVNQAELGFEGVYRGAPPSVPAAVVTWLATAPADEARALNGTTVSAQRFALERGLHPDWRTRPAG